MKYCCILLFLVSLLPGCQSTGLLHKRLTPEQQSCVQMCVKKQQHCQALCRNNCKNCQRVQAVQSKHSWCTYAHERKVMGDVLFRQLNSYKDPLQCQKVTCNCQADFMVCEQSCKGSIRKTLTVLRQCRWC